MGNVTPVVMSHASPFSKGYKITAEVMALESTYYYIRNTTRTTKNGLPIFSLYMKTRAAGTGGFTAPVELVEGVEDMRFEFGVDDDDDGVIDRYVKTGDMLAADWGNIVSVRINLLLQGVDDKAVTGGNGKFAQAINFYGAPVAADGRLRQTFAVVAAVRNRLD